ncbi:MAG TPA: valine--tRNA ligase, partial [Bacteroidales bacterium]
KNYNARFEPVLIKMAGLETVSITSEKVDNTDSFMVLSTEFYLKTGITIDKEAESLKIKEELEYTKGFLASVMKKLSNERFVSGAPAQVVEMEKKKQADAEAKIKALEERLAALN